MGGLLSLALVFFLKTLSVAKHTSGERDRALLRQFAAIARAFRNGPIGV
jgi:hypothetical protein